jgi:hypothetical protein
MPILFKDLFKRADHISFIKYQGYQLDSPIDAPHKETGDLIIHCAAEYDQQEMLAILIEANVNVDMVSSTGNFAGQTPLGVALSSVGSDKAAAFLIDKGADCEQCDTAGAFPLMRAVKTGSTENILRLLVDKKVDINQENLISSDKNYKSLPYKGMTALMYAAEGSAISSIKILIGRGASLINFYGRSVFEYCFNERLKELVLDEVEKRRLKTRELHKQLRDKMFFPPPLALLVCSYTAGYNYEHKFFNPKIKALEPSKKKEELVLNKKRKASVLV